MRQGEKDCVLRLNFAVLRRFKTRCWGKEKNLKIRQNLVAKIGRKFALFKLKKSRKNTPLKSKKKGFKKLEKI